MKFECGDLERALSSHDLMPEAREHLKQCAACRREYRLWNEISSGARLLHEEWDSPELWPGIRRAIEAEPRPSRHAGGWNNWRTWAAAAAVIAIAVGLSITQPWQRPHSPEIAATAQKRNSADRDFLTEQALADVQKTEAAYRHSIQKLSELAQPKLADASSPQASDYKEKLLLIDSAIADTRATLDHNRFNVHLQTELADLYREKQQTLEEILRDQKN